jgi:hypothetical protein
MLASRSAPRVEFENSIIRPQPEMRSPRKEIACSSSAWKGNPNPSFLRVNFALEGNRLWELVPSKRNFPLEVQYKQISLGDLIQSESANWPEMIKLILAVTLAHSLLYLNDGAWLNGYWSRSKIVFYKSRAFVPARPFLRTQISNVVNMQPDLHDGIHKHPGNLELGIALLEIHLGKRIDDLSTTTSHRWGIASQILNQERLNLRDDYRNAVIACLQPDFGNEAGFTPQQFRKHIFDKIVSPLQKEFENGFKGIIKPTLLDEAATKVDLVSGQFLDVLSAQESLALLSSKPSPGKILTQPVATQRLASLVNAIETNLTGQDTIIEKNYMSLSRLTAAKSSTSFNLYENENQSQNIPVELYVLFCVHFAICFMLSTNLS